MLSIATQINKIRNKDPYLAEALTKIVDAHNALNQQAGVDTTGVVTPPSAPNSMNVVAANGVYEIAIVDLSSPKVGINYFVVYSTKASLTGGTPVDMGAARNIRLFLGNQTLFFGCYSQYRNSAPSPITAFGGQNPIAVIGGGVAGPAPLPSQGSGAGSPGMGTSGFGVTNPVNPSLRGPLQ